MSDAELLFRPFSSPRLTLDNRVVMAPMSRYRSPGGVPGKGVAAYYRRRAEGGAGLIITEATLIDHPGANGYDHVPHAYGDDALAEWRRVVSGVHEAGAKIFLQLWHVGSIRQVGMPPDEAVPGFAPSPMVHPNYKGKGPTPHEMTQRDVDDVIAAYTSAAANAVDVGFDGVEIHGAHGYLIDQFFWADTNQREDQYGGSLVERTRFACEVIRSVRAAIGNAPLALRFSQWKMGAYRHKMATTPAELSAFLEPLSEAGVDLFHCSTRRFFEPEFADSELNLAGWTRKLTGKPVITVGSVGLTQDVVRTNAGAECVPASIEPLLERFARDEFDLVAVGRAMITDAEWANKVREGHADAVVPFRREAIDAPLV